MFCFSFKGDSPLHQDACKGNVNMVKLLSSLGADFSARNDKVSSFFFFINIHTLSRRVTHCYCILLVISYDYNFHVYTFDQGKIQIR